MRKLIIIAAASGALAVVLGAFGAHGLKSLLTAAQLNTFETGVRYQMYHALALLALPVLIPLADLRWLRRAGMAFILGTLLFSGSLYMMVLLQAAWAGPITPVGGGLFILGWLALIIALWKGQRHD
ncbi:DUF423 domain-containing protein [Alteromonas sp. ASW11-19]|uniref:DUF423 domain-containing protein n=1 Tax=Alteromonas salexigens TaxID=2982530 RepID=A0ABT2VPJ3_9ALTE|nr:DUF423 domain-containing protein [Alteromonas salexigens]MCU7553844.1 DUF423 domain-containing protein [Alteromonas salexigens]